MDAPYRKQTITEKDILKRLKASEAFTPPLTVSEQYVLLFFYRVSLRECLILLERVEEKERSINRMGRGNAELSRIIEDWIIKNPTKKTTL